MLVPKLYLVFPVMSFPCTLDNSLVDIDNIAITSSTGGNLGRHSKVVKVSFNVVYGDDKIAQIRYVLMSKNRLNYAEYTDTTGVSRDHTFTLDHFVVSSQGDIVIAQIDIQDIDGGVRSFNASKFMQGDTQQASMHDLRFYQRNDGSNMVDIYYFYDFQGGEINDSSVILEYGIPINGSTTWKAATNLKGDYGQIMPGRRRIIWNAGSDLSAVVPNTSVLCRLTLYDADHVQGTAFTGALVWDFNKSEVAVRKLTEKEEEDMEQTSSSSSSSSTSESSPSSSSSSSLNDINIENVSSAACIATNTTSLTFSHTISGSRNRILTVGVQAEHFDTTMPIILSVTYDGVPMTLIGTLSINNPTQNSDRSSLYYLPESDLPTAGSYSVVVTMGFPTLSITAGAISFRNASQSGVPAYTTVGALSRYVSTAIAATEGSLIVDSLVDSLHNGMPITTGANQTLQYTEPTAGGHAGAGSTVLVSSDGNVIIGWDSNITVQQLGMVVAVFPPYGS